MRIRPNQNINSLTFYFAGRGALLILDVLPAGVQVLGRYSDFMNIMLFIIILLTALQKVP